MKRLAIILLALLLLAGCSSEPNIEDLGGKPVTYDSIEELADAADLIVTGKVLTSDTQFSNFSDGQVKSILNIVQFEIASVEKGELQPGDIIAVVQTSGYDGETNTSYEFGMMPALMANRNYQLYLRHADLGTTTQYYTPVNYQSILPHF